MKGQKFRLILIILISALAGYYVGVNKISADWRNFQPHVEVASKEPPPSVQNADFRLFWEVLDRLEKTYYDKKAIDAQKIVNGAISGMVESMDDPYTVYLPPQQNTDFKQGLAGKFEGIGAELGIKSKDIIIVAPLDGSPAQKAGLKPGDIIAKVGNQYTAGWTVNQAVEKIRGPKGTEVVLTIIRKEGEPAKEITIVRDTITMKSLFSWTKPVKEIDGIKQTDILKKAADDKIVYIRLSQFGDTANEEWSAIAAKVDREMAADTSIKGIVFDLRNNPGGYLKDAVYIASEFIKSGVAVMQEDRNGDRKISTVSGNGLLADVPVVILINEGSASASEIVAGALRDNKRAILVGESSFGKGTIQEAEDLGGGAGLHVTVAKWLTPNGTWVHQKGQEPDAQKGLAPDIKVAVDTDDQSHDIQLEKAVEELVK